MKSDSLSILETTITACNQCPRLRDHCTAVAAEKRRAFRDWDYWGRPVSGFGDPNAWLWIIGLAPAAHGANRTGRIFTGDRSGDFLFAALHRFGIANQPHSTSRTDGLALTGCFISPAVRCAPPANKPLPDEIANCAPYLDHEWNLLPHKRILLALGQLAWDASLSLGSRHGLDIPRPRPRFSHAATVNLGPLTLLGSYHVSQQNTFTGKLTPQMFDAILTNSRNLAQG